MDLAADAWAWWASLSPPTASFLVSTVAPAVIYVVYGLFCQHVMDGRWARDAACRRSRKIQPEKIPGSDAYAEAWRVGARNWVISFAFGALLCWVVHPALGMPAHTDPLPSFWGFLQQFAMILLVEEVLFFSSHWALHRKSVYAAVHKEHHTFTAPFAIACIYAHPLEHMISNIGPVSAGPMLVRAHPLLAGLWTCLAVANTMTSHSGWAGSQGAFHDWHHEKFEENFGVLGILDWLCGTSREYDRRWWAGELALPREKRSSKAPPAAADAVADGAGSASASTKAKAS